MAKILLAVTGLNPQVVTETLYGMLINNEKMPDEIVLLTTAKGKLLAEQSLLLGINGEPGKVTEFCVEYNLPEINISSDNIKPICDENGLAIDDIRTEESHNIMADFITNEVRVLTADPAVVLHASI